MLTGYTPDIANVKPMSLKSTIEVNADDVRMATRHFYNSLCALSTPTHKFTQRAEEALVAHCKWFLLDNLEHDKIRIITKPTVPHGFCNTNPERVTYSARKFYFHIYLMNPPFI